MLLNFKHHHCSWSTQPAHCRRLVHTWSVCAKNLALWRNFSYGLEKETDSQASKIYNYVHKIVEEKFLAIYWVITAAKRTELTKTEDQNGGEKNLITVELWNWWNMTTVLHKCSFPREGCHSTDCKNHNRKIFNFKLEYHDNICIIVSKNSFPPSFSITVYMLKKLYL